MFFNFKKYQKAEFQQFFNFQKSMKIPAKLPSSLKRPAARFQLLNLQIRHSNDAFADIEQLSEHSTCVVLVLDFHVELLEHRLLQLVGILFQNFVESIDKVLEKRGSGEIFN